MVEAIVDNQNRIFPVCTNLNGEYGLKNVFLGVPVRLGENGIEEIININLTKEERLLLSKSSKAVTDVMNLLDDMNLFEGDDTKEKK